MGLSEAAQLLSGEPPPTSGRLLLHGAEVAGWPSWRFARAGVGLVGAAGRTSGALSHGQLRQFEIAMAISAGRSVLLLNEPFAGMGPEEGERPNELRADEARMAAYLGV